jgi:hypothetical protein
MDASSVAECPTVSHSTRRSIPPHNGPDSGGFGFPIVAMLPTMLEQDRRREGWSVGRAAWALRVSIREYRELEAGTRTPTFETWDRICKLFGCPQTFVGWLRGRSRTAALGGHPVNWPNRGGSPR